MSPRAAALVKLVESFAAYDELDDEGRRLEDERRLLTVPELRETLRSVLRERGEIELVETRGTGVAGMLVELLGEECPECRPSDGSSVRCLAHALP